MKLITRSDDLGLNQSANLAIGQVIQVGWIKNVSVMAVGKELAQAAELADRYPRTCFGMHGVLTSEWDTLKWGSLSRQEVLEDGQGHFLPTAADFARRNPPIEAVLKEYDRQLDRLCALGFPIRYVDSHMETERETPQLFEAIRQWALGHGLVFAGDYSIPLSSNLFELPNDPDAFEKCLREEKRPVCLYVGHPAFYSRETKGLQNANNPGRTAALQRYLDYLFAINPKNILLCQQMQVDSVAYSQL